MSASRRIRVNRALGATVLWQGLAIAFAMMFHLVSARWLGTEGRGTLSIWVSAGQIAAMFLGLGFPGAISYYAASDSRLTGLLVRREAQLLCVMTAIVGALLLVNRGWSWWPLPTGADVALGLFVIGNIALPAFGALALARGSVLAYNMSTVVSAAGALIGLVILRSLGMADSATALGVFAAATIVGVLIPLAVLRAPSDPQDSADIRALPVKSQLHVASLGFVSNGFAVLATRADIFLVSLLGGGAAAAGLYSVGVFLAEMMTKVPNWAGVVLAPVVASGQRDSVPSTIGLCWLSFVMVGVGYLPVILFPGLIKTLLTGVAGGDFIASYPVLVVMLPRIVAQATGAIVYGNLAGKGYTLYHPAGTGAGLGVMVILDLVLIRRFGIVGAAIGSGAGQIVSTAVAFVGFLRVNGITAADFMRMSGTLLTTWRARLTSVES